MPPRYALAKRQALDLLKRARITSAPVPVEELASLLRAEIVFQRFLGEISGVVYRDEEGAAIIGVNSRHRPPRQRFTIAHEIGHLLLHADENLHVDRNFPIGLRNGISGKSIDDNEIEANQFAATLLMPPDFIAADVKPLIGKDVLDVVKKLARKYEVSEEAMSIRLSSLRYIELGD